MSVPLRPLLAVLAALLGAALAPVAAPAAEPAPAAPSCAEGPERVGTEILGTPCADRIVVPATVARVDGGGGDDTILAAPIPAAAQECSGGCFGGVGSQTIEGGTGNDLIFGQRGNDTLRGGPGNDRLYGGIGDDKLEGGEGDDFLYGGFGGDAIDGQGGSDLVRGDGTIDNRCATPASAAPTRSATRAGPPRLRRRHRHRTRPGFPAAAAANEASILQLGVGGLNGNNGIAETGGGVDEVDGRGLRADRRLAVLRLHRRHQCRRDDLRRRRGRRDQGRRRRRQPPRRRRRRRSRRRHGANAPTAAPAPTTARTRRGRSADETTDHQGRVPATAPRSASG